MSIKICDALCGSGKTTACINMMNERTDRKFMFVTQFLDEADRIIKACPERNFVTPTTESENATKLANLRKLVKDGRCIATTHSLFLNFTEEVKGMIREQGYVLVLDEVIETLSSANLETAGFNILQSSGVVEEKESGEVLWMQDCYARCESGRFYKEMLMARSKNFFSLDGQCYFWSIPLDVFEAFEESYVLTYLFEAQTLCYFFKMNNVAYEYVGVKKDGKTYHFCPLEEMDRARDLRDKIHILDHKKLNAIGGVRTNLSKAWHKDINGKGNIEHMRRNIQNVFKNVFKAKSSDVLWTSFKQYRSDLSGKGYQYAFIPYNLRASNAYADRHYLAFCLNVFPRPMEVKYYKKNGVELNGDMQALSVLVQWVFRSAIRKGEEIWIYVPSARMRNILRQWIENLANGNDLAPVNYKSPRRNYYQEKKEKMKK